MTRQRALYLGLAAAVTLVALSACGDDGNHTVPVPPTSGNSQDANFSAFAYQVYEEPANSTPINFDTTVFVYDADNDPAAFSGLFM